MNLAWSTAVILALILPGIFFLKGIGLAERFSRDATPRSPTAQLALAVLISILVHAVMVVAISLLPLPQPNVQALLLLAAGPLEGRGMSIVLRSLSGYATPIASYFLVCSAMGVGLGWLLGWGALKFKFSSQAVFEHAWLHDLIGGPTQPLAFALTKATLGGKLLIYVGELHRFGVRQDGRFSFLVLKRASRGLMESGAAFSSATATTWKEICAEATEPLLYLDGESLTNVFFKMPEFGPATPENSEFLKAALATVEAAAGAHGTGIGSLQATTDGTPGPRSPGAGPDEPADAVPQPSSAMPAIAPAKPRVESRGERATNVD